MSLKQDFWDAMEFTGIMLGSDWLASRVTLRGHAALRAREASNSGDGDDLFAETTAEATARRLRACELHLADLEERLTDRGVFSG